MSCRLACILAAGMGTRLGPMPRPKGLLRLGSTSLVERSLEQLFASGVERVVLVTGHLASCYEVLAGDERVVRVHNSRYADTGSLYSLGRAQAYLDQPYLLLESDLLYEDRALTVVQEAPEDDLILVSGFGGAGDEVFVEARNGHLVRLSKDRSRLGSPPLGEFVGICKVSMELNALLVSYLAGAGERLEYDHDGLAACAPTRGIPCRLVEDLVWTEIDDPGHLDYAQTRILPCLQDSSAAGG